MTPAERRAWALVERRARDLSPDLITAILRAYKLLRDNLSADAVAQLIAQGRLVEAVNAAVPAELIERALIPVTNVLTDGTMRTARATVKVLPPKARAVLVAFNTLDPRIIDAVRVLNNVSLGTVAPELRQAVRQHIEAGLQAGVNPRTMARGLRDVIGLAPNQEAAVRNFEDALRSGDFAKARGYQLRDKRFDATLKRAAPTDAQIDTMTSAYRRRMLAFNAETHARTAALDAQKVGQRLAWQEAKASGALGDANVWKRWVATDDDRVRDEHWAMNGEEQPLDTPYSNGEMTPGDSTWNCRCVETYFVKAPAFSLAA